MYKYVYFWKIKDPDFSYKPVVLITGCSSGIGAALAKKYQHDIRYRVVLTAREKSIGLIKQEFQENERLIILPLDVTQDWSRRQLIKNIYDRWGSIDILINNAGICYRSALEEMLDQDEFLQMQTNYLGPVSLIRLLLPKMRKQGYGKIINISSVSGALGVPTMASYSASKFALEGAMEALWYEVKPFGIDVSVVQPSFVRSKSYERVKFSVRSKLSIANNRPYSFLYNSMIPFVSKLMENAFATPETIAELVYEVVRSNKPPMWIPASLDAEIFFIFKRFFPKNLLPSFMYFLLPNSSHWGSEVNKLSPNPWIDRVLNKIKFWEKLYNGKN